MATPPANPNPLKGEVAFEAAGARWVLAFTIDAICGLEARVARTHPRIDTMSLIVANLQARAPVWLARTVLHVGLSKHHPELTEQEAGELIPALRYATTDAEDRPQTLRAVGAAVALIAQAVGDLFGDDDLDAEDDAEAGGSAPAGP